MANKQVTLKRVTDTSGNTDNIYPTTEWAQIESKPTTFAPTAHTHDVDDINASGTPSSTTYLRGDGTWATVEAGGTVDKEDLQNVYVYGKASGAITKGQAVQFAGAQGGHILIKTAVQSEINAAPNYIVGLAETDLADNAFGYVIVNGRLNMDTSVWDEGDILYFDSAGSTAGALTTTEPGDPNACIEMAAVSVDGVGNGELLVRTTLLTRTIDEVTGLQAALDGKVAKAGDTMTGNLTIQNTLPKITFNDTNNNSDYHIANNNGTLEIADTTNQEARIQIGSTGNITLPSTGGLTLVDKAITNSSGSILWDGDEIYHEGHKPTFSEIASKPTTLSGYGITDAYTQTQVNSQISTAVSNLVDSSPATLDTLNELAAALGDDPNFATTVSNSIGTKVAKSGDTMTGTLVVGQVDSGNPGAGTDNLRVSGYGILGNRGSIYVTNQNTSGDIQFGIGGVHAAATKMKISSNGVVDIGGNTVFHDGYHPNADKLTTARNIALAGDVTGSANFDGSGNISITATVANDSHTHDGRYYTESESNGRYLARYSTTSALNVNAANGTQLFTGSTGAWTNRGPSGNNAGALLSLNTHSGNYYSQLWFDTANRGLYHRRANGGTGVTESWQRIFADDYHPNADKWTTARTITLGGDLSGSVSLDGSANVTLSAQVTNGSHTHDDRYYTESEVNSLLAGKHNAGYSVFSGDAVNRASLASRTESGFYEHDTAATADGWPVNGSWYHAISATHSNDGNYHAMQFAGDFFNSNNVFYRATGNVGTATWHRLWHSGNDGSGSGLDADLLDGLHESTFLRREANSTLDMNNYDIYGVDQIFHHGDTNTYTQFHASDQWRVVTGGSQRFEVNNSYNFFSTPVTIGTETIPTNSSFHTEGNATIRDNINVGDITIGGGGTFYTDSGSRIRTNQNFYVTTSNIYLYGDNTYIGNSSGDAIRFRANTLIGDGWNISPNGTGQFFDLEVTGNRVWNEGNLSFSLSGSTLTITTS